MEVILVQDLNQLGTINEIVKVKNGYGRNFLIPKKIAIEATPSALKQLEEKMKIVNKKREEMLAQLNKVIAKLENTKITLKTKVGTSGKIFGSITNVMLAREIKNQTGFEIERKKINYPDNISEIGIFKAEIDFGNGKKGTFDFEIVSE